jgi:hypothetical protein
MGKNEEDSITLVEIQIIVRNLTREGHDFSQVFFLKAIIKP